MRAYYMTSHCITWHDTTQKKTHTSHQMTWHDTTSHHMTWHDISQLTTLPHLTSPRNQPHYFVTSQPTTWHHVPHHRTLHHHHRHTTETQPATTKMPPPDGTAEGWCTQKTLFGHRTGWSPCAHSIGKFFFWFIVLFPWNFRPWLARELLVIPYINGQLAVLFFFRSCRASETRLYFSPRQVGGNCSWSIPQRWLAMHCQAKCHQD